jgi:hypothetical protein
MAGARAVHLAEPHARIDQDQLPAGIHNERILVDREIALVEEIGSENLVDPLLGDALEHLCSECAELKRTIRNHRAFESAELEAIGGG